MLKYTHNIFHDTMSFYLSVCSLLCGGEHVSYWAWVGCVNYINKEIFVTLVFIYNTVPMKNSLSSNYNNLLKNEHVSNVNYIPIVTK